MNIIENIELRFRQLDKDARLLRGVSVLRPTSQRGARRYTEAAMKDVTRLAEKAKVFFDHKVKIQDVRSMRDLIGSLENLRLDDIVKGDLRFLPKHTALIEALAMDNVPGIGLSIHAFAPRTTKESGGVEVVQNVAHIVSVDLVSEAGSTMSLFESIGNGLRTSELQNLIWDILQKNTDAKSAGNLLKSRLVIPVSAEVETEEDLFRELKKVGLIESVDVVMRRDRMLVESLGVRYTDQPRPTEVVFDLADRTLTESLGIVYKAPFKKLSKKPMAKKAVDPKDRMLTEAFGIQHKS